MATSILAKPAVSYLRMSTDKQDESIETQRELVTMYAADKGYQIAGEYHDDAISGTSINRPGFQQMVAAASRGEFQYVIVRDQGRLSRFEPAKWVRFLDEMRDLGVTVVSTTTGEIDPSDLSQLIMTTVTGHGDNKHAIDTSLITIQKQAIDVAAGWAPGKPTPYGYYRQYYDASGNPRVVVKNGDEFTKPKGEGWKARLIPGDPAEIAVVCEIFQWYVGGDGFAGIAHRLNERGIRAKRGGTRTTRRKNGKTYAWRRYICSGFTSHGTTVCERNRVNADDAELAVAELLIATWRDSRRRSAIATDVRIAAQAKIAEAKAGTVGDTVRARIKDLDAKIEKAKAKIVEVDDDDLAESWTKRLTKYKIERAGLLERIPAPDAAEIDVDQLVAAAMARCDAIAESLEESLAKGAEPLRDAFFELLDKVSLTFETVQVVDKKKKARTKQVCTGGIVTLQKSEGSLMAGTRPKVNVPRWAA